MLSALTTKFLNYFKMADAIAVFYNINVMKINLRLNKACKKKIYHACKVQTDKSVPQVTVGITE